MVDGRAVSVRPVPAPPRTDDGRVDLVAIAEALRGAPTTDAPRVLESVPGLPGTGRWSYVVAGVAGRLVWRERGGGSANGLLRGLEATADPVLALADACERAGVSPHGPTDAGLPPFPGGLVGGLSYDLARAIERLPDRAVDDRSDPWLDLAVADIVVAVDHREESALLVHRHVDPRRTQRELADTLERIGAVSALSGGSANRAGGPPARTTLPRRAYLAAVHAILEHVAAGDTFQVNLAQRLTARWDGDVTDLYRALRTASPAPYGAIVPCGGDAAASISPETFLDVGNGRATVRPIKGTRRRGADAGEDARLRDELAASGKDRSENVMVVDMERNDLGRVCVPGTVEVPRLCDVEGHPTVWHLVSEVTGTLRPDATYADLVRATFPCGSVTGTPKVRAMQLIDRYEPVRRGWYCGAIGFLADGAASLSVAIRTAVLRTDGEVDYGAGGGIVAESDPAAEHAESLAKAAAFLRAVGAAPPDA